MIGRASPQLSSATGPTIPDALHEGRNLTLSDIKVEKNTKTMDSYVADLIAKDQALKAAKKPAQSKKRTAEDLRVQEQIS